MIKITINKKALHRWSVVDKIPADSKRHTAGVHSKGNPPRVLSVQLLVKVFEHQEPHGEPREGAHQVGSVADMREELLLQESVPDCEAYVRAG